MDNDEILDKAYYGFCRLLHNLRCFGITRMQGMLGVRGNVTGSTIILRADPELAGKIDQAYERTIPVDVVDAYRMLGQSVLPLVDGGHLFFSGNEPLMIALADSSLLADASVTIHDGHYHVPRANGIDYWQLLDPALDDYDEAEFKRLFDHLDPYSRILGYGSVTLPPRFPDYNPDATERARNMAWMNFMVLPDVPDVSATQMAQSLMVTCPGWSFMAGQSPNMIAEQVGAYRELLPYAIELS